MFDFKRLMRIKEMDFKNLINRIIPKGNKIKVKEEIYKDILSGSILLTIGSILCLIGIISFGLYIFLTNSYLFEHIKNFGVDTSINIGSSPMIIFSIIILIYSILMKDKEQLSVPYMIVGIVELVWAIGLVFSLIGAIVLTVFFPVSGIMILIGDCICLVGYLFSILACIDFCLEANASFIGSKGGKYCSNCGEKISGKFCSNCGSQIE